MISFDGFPETNNPSFRLTPRSHESLKRTGFKPEDLIVRTAEEVNNKYADNVTDRALIDKRLAHYE
jgi:hypothetical protein